MTRQILLVEGADDLHFFVHLLNYHKFPLNKPSASFPNMISIEDGVGAQNILENRLSIIIKALSDEAEQNQLGLVFDTDLDIEQRWQSIRNRLQIIGYKHT